MAFVDRVGIALVFPGEDLVLPSLWEAVAGQTPIDWAVRDDEGRFLEFTPEFDRVWRWKDELPEQRLVCGGKHVRGRAALVSLDLLPALYALTGRPGRPDDFRDADLSATERDVAEAVLEAGPGSTGEIHELLPGHARKRVTAAIDSLQRKLVLTGAGARRRERGWPAVMSDVLARRYGDRLRRLPTQDEARTELTAAVLDSARELSVADLSAALGFSKHSATATLDGLVAAGRARRREEEGYSLWAVVKRR